MAHNVSYFLSIIPHSFDGWNTTNKLDYYNINLNGFSSINITSQQWVVSSLSVKDLEDLYKVVITPGYQAATVANNITTTELFLYYISSPDLWTQLWNSMVTAATPTPTVNPCSTVSELDNTVLIFMALPALFVLLVLSFFKRRTKLCKSCCWGRPYLVYPVNFIDEHNHRWAYVSVFILITNKVLTLFEGRYFWSPNQFGDPVWMQTYGFTRVFVVMVNVLLMCLCYHPFLACISMRKHLIANVMGLVYLAPWLWHFAAVWNICPAWNKYGSSTILHEAILHTVFEIPNLLAFLVLTVTYCANLGFNLYILYVRIKRPEVYKEKIKELTMQDPQSILYLKDLLLKSPKKKPKTKKEMIKDKVIYESVRGFKYSPRMLCTMAVAALALLKIAVTTTTQLQLLYDFGVGQFDLLESTFTQQNATTDFFYLRDYFIVARWSVFACLWFSFVIQVAFMVHMILCYRNHIRNYFKGDKSWHHKVTSSPASIMVASLRYSGYQIAYILYGYFIMSAVLGLIFFAFGVLVVLSFKWGYGAFIIQLIKDYWPTIFLGLAIWIGQLILARLCLLQGRGKYIALNNIRFYHLMNYLLFFYNFILGIFSCLKRLLISVVVGSVLISRLDRCLLMRGFEQFDPGFNAYIGMIILEVYHIHPILKSFVYLLSQSVEKTDNQGLEDDNGALPEKFSKLDENRIYPGDIEIGDMKKDSKDSLAPKRSKKWKNKWLKAVTLINNPSLTLDLFKEDLKAAKHHKIKDSIINQAGNVVSGVAGAAILNKMFE